MTRPRPTIFELSDRPAGKADPALIDDDERRLEGIAECLRQSTAELSDRLAAERLTPGGKGQAAVERDMRIHRWTGRLTALRRFGVDLCLGHIAGAGGADSADSADGARGADGSAGAEPTYVGRLGLTDATGHRMVVDWRSPAAEPFFAATHANPMGLIRRRRYRWTRGRISDYWDEVFITAGLADRAALDDQSAFIASLGDHRTPRMRDVLGTIAAEQDAVVRAGSAGVLVVDGGPGTGKTVVALHRSAYLLYADPRLGHHRGGLLFIGPHQAYLSYVADVLPSLGEEGVLTCTLRDLVTEGATAAVESDPAVAALKSTAELVGAIEAAVRFYEEAPTTPMTVTTPWSTIQLGADDWADAFRAAEPGGPHNEAREEIRAELVRIIVDRHHGAAPEGLIRAALLPPRRTARGSPSGVAVDRSGGPRLRPVVGARLPAPLRAVAQPRRHPPAAAARRAGLDGVGPAAAGRRATKAR